MSSSYKTKCEVTNDYKYSFPPFNHIIEGNHLEVFKEIHDGHLYYLDTKQKALISAYCVIGLPNTTYNNSEKAGKKCRNVYC